MNRFFSLLALWLAGVTSAMAGCSRPIQVPVAAIGFSVTVKNGEVGGVFPEMLNAVMGRLGCELRWSVVPRARLEAMFETGRADILLAATHSARRDQYGVFIPMVSSRATMVSLKSRRAPINTMAQLLEMKELRVALVRGYDYGEAYQDLIQKLTAQGRLYLEPDPLSVARLLSAGMADVSILPPSVMLAVAQNDPRVEPLLAQVRFEALAELPWIPSGVYLSLRSLSPADRVQIEAALVAAGKSGVLYQAFRKVFPPDILAEGTRPL
ncbi:ABC transporter substrate-binding protein [Massilia sp. TS11]|uniref:substrate-binding periplasmic protein n=1 Tax=Massilia sp. TS11 TaxID=2908003 RepID=UPI001EDA694D|nr:transporter substrate-binding domain-containing protein [Massilia sp. TS11]MCG2585790.1 transporter substrate-binding domain-containing protein [Massilia sp. TS11]